MSQEKHLLKRIGHTIQTLMENQTAHTATMILTPSYTIRVHRTVYHGKNKKPMFAKHVGEFRVTLGKPNAAAREFILKCQRVGERFPISRIQLVHMRQK